MSEVKTLLDELDSILKKYNEFEYEKLQPPLSNEEIDFYFEELGINDENLKTLYQWKNGAKERSQCQMMIFGGLQSLAAIKKSISMDRDYDSHLVEIISDNGEESLLFNIHPGPHYGKLYLYSVPRLYIDYPISCFDSLGAMLKTVIEAYKNEAFLYDKQRNFLKVYYDKFASIAKENNKNSVYWTNHNPLMEEEWYEI
jgi:hypothetical protein